MGGHRVAFALASLAGAAILGSGCGDASGGAADAGTDAGADAGEQLSIAEQEFGGLAPWARPIDDYIAVGEATHPGVFSSDVNELQPFGGRMFIGYGDANYNLGGEIPIEFRFFASPDDPAAAAVPVDGEGEGELQETPTQSGEEQIDRYRVLDGELWQAGIDSIDADELWTQAHTDPPGIEGNCYRLVGGTMEKHRSIVGGEHVHDLASFGGAVYGVGSGADTREEFEAGQIFRYLWRSDDLGESFETVTRVQHPEPGAGDTRWVHLLPTGGALFLFGYESDFDAGIAYVHNAAYDGVEVADLPDDHALVGIFPTGTAAFPDGTGVAFGVNVSLDPIRYDAVGVAADGTAQPLDGLAGTTVLDALYVPETGEILYLAFAGDAYGEWPTSFDASILVAPATAPGETVPLLSFTTDVEPRAIAYWGGHLFLGTKDGQVLRSE